MSISNFEYIEKRCELLAPFTIRLVDFSPEEAAEIFELLPGVWCFAPEEFESRLKADPHAEIRVRVDRAIYLSDKEFSGMNKILDKARKAV